MKSGTERTNARILRSMVFVFDFMDKIRVPEHVVTWVDLWNTGNNTFLLKMWMVFRRGMKLWAARQGSRKRRLGIIKRLVEEERTKHHVGGA
jgi:hypothetical protein